jgi:hypothetical protein
MLQKVIRDLSFNSYRFLFKGFAYVAIMMLLLLIGFIVFMDLLKYVFGIDPAKANLDTIRKDKMMKRKKKKLERAKIAYRYQYVN